MENTNEIKIGNLTVSKESLKGITIGQAKEKYNYVDSRIVEKAFYIVNPKRKPRQKATEKTKDK